MLTVETLLKLAKDRQQLASYYKLAQVLDVTQNTMSNYRNGRSRPDDKLLSRLGELAEVPQSEIELLAVQLQAERASTDQARQLWQRLAMRLQSGAVHASVLLGVAMVSIAGYAPNAEATALLPAEKQSGSLYIMLSKARKALKALRRASGAIFGGFFGSFHVQSAYPDAAHLNAA